MPAHELPPLPTDLNAIAALAPAAWARVLQADPATGLAWMRAAASLGHAPAQLVLGQWLLDGHGSAPDAPMARQWFIKAARQGDAMAMNMAGRCHENGWGGPVDLEQAVYWYRQAAEAGLDAGMYNYANQLASGKAVAQDHARALDWYRKAAGLGHAKSMTKAGRYFEDGLVVPRDPAMAFASYRAAAQGGDFRGQFCYAGMLAARGAVQEALAWLRKVPATATPGFLAEAGQALLQSPHAEVQRIGRQMLARVTAVGAPPRFRPSAHGDELFL